MIKERLNEKQNRLTTCSEFSPANRCELLRDPFLETFMFISRLLKKMKSFEQKPSEGTTIDVRYNIDIISDVNGYY